MKNSQKGFVVPLLITIIAILALGSGTYIYVSKKAPEFPAPIINNEVSTSTSNQTPKQDSVSKPEIQKSSTTSVQNKIIYDEKNISECIKGYQLTYTSKEAYSAGTIFVLFEGPVSLSLAEKIILSYNLSSQKPINEFVNYPALHVNVKNGEEFLWSCRLKQDMRIKYAEPSPITTVASLAPEKASGIIKSIYSKEGKNYLDIDYVEFVPGGPNGVGITNNNPKIRTFEISNSTKLLVNSFCIDKNKCTGNEKQILTLEQFSNIFNIKDYSINNVTYLKYNPWDILVKNGVVIEISEHFMP